MKVIAGKVIVIGGRELEVPPLNIVQLKKYSDVVNARIADDESGFDFMVKQSEVIHAAIQRNYPDIPLEWVQEHVDLANIREIYGAVMAINGIMPSGDKQPGETQPVESIGTQSSVQ